MIGRVLVSAGAKLKVPGPVVLGPMAGRGALSGDVVALDSHTLMVRPSLYPHVFSIYTSPSLDQAPRVRRQPARHLLHGGQRPRARAFRGQVSDNICLRCDKESCRGV